MTTTLRGRPPKAAAERKVGRLRLLFSLAELDEVALAARLSDERRSVWARSVVLEAARAVLRRKMLGNL